MPVNRSSLIGVRDVVMHIDNDGVTPVCLYDGPGKGSVDKQDVPLIPVRAMIPRLTVNS